MTTDSPAERAALGTVGVLLMTFGSPKTLDDIPAYLASVRGGRGAPEDLIVEFQRRYRLVGGSRLIDLTRGQGQALEIELRRLYPDGPPYEVAIGMRHSPPFIGDAIREFSDGGISRVVAIIMSPQYSPIIMSGYHRLVDEAIATLNERGRTIDARVSGAWNRNEWFLRALAERVCEALDRLPPEVRDTVPVLLTSHSLPKRVVEREPEYLDQLRDTVREMVERVGLAADRWQFAYQSAGHTPEEWLTPDMKDLLPGIREQGHRHVLMVPVQFLSDHLEIQYDIDVAACEDAERLGLELHRTESLNLSPPFIRALADVVESLT